MTQLDIPPISIARYLELLKRRRWQVIPVTILGLLLGTAVAFLIPRYYVARTQFTFHGELIDAPIGAGSQDDPMRAVVDSAKVLLPSTVPAVLDLLAWPEAKDEDVNRRRGFIEAVKERVTVEDPLGGYRSQQIVTLQINYRDTNGERSAELTNALRDHFITNQRERLVARVRRSLDDVQEEVEAATLAIENASIDLRNHRSEYGIGPLFDQVGEIGVGRSLRSERAEATNKLTTLSSQLEAYRRTLAAKKELISAGTISPRRAITSEDPIAQAMLSEQRAVRQQLRLLKLKLGNLKPAHPDYRLLEREIGQYSSLLALDPGGERTQILNEPNPLYASLKLEISELESTVLGFTELQARQQEAVIALDVREAALPDIWQRYEAFKNAYNEALAEKERVRERESGLLQRFDSVDNEDAFEILFNATVPPAPTEPSIVVVAALGSLIGLVQAIALILIIDFLQSTFKTVEDVERGLSLPVLGGMAYLQTRDEQIKAKAQRRKVAFVSIAFLSLSLAVIMIYYLAPTNLPRVVYQALDMILGGTG